METSGVSPLSKIFPKKRTQDSCILISCLGSRCVDEWLHRPCIFIAFFFPNFYLLMYMRTSNPIRTILFCSYHFNIFHFLDSRHGFMELVVYSVQEGWGANQPQMLLKKRKKDFRTQTPLLQINDGGK